MATYIYETIPSKPNQQPRTYELTQSMRDDAYTHHPETGEPIRRVITGGYGILTDSTSSTPGTSTPNSGGGCCGGSCRCCH